MADEFPPPSPPHPPPMADGESPPWADLPNDVVVEIASRFQCVIDRRCGEVLCHSWRAAFLQLEPPPRQLPWLVVPRADGPAFHCVPSNWRTHAHSIPHGARHARYFGSYEGLWLFLSVHQANHHILLSLHNYGDFFFLPNVSRQRVIIRPHRPVQLERRIVIVAATLSCRPNEQGCVAAGIFGFHGSPNNPWNIAFWRMGDQAITQYFPPTNQELEVEDLLYRRGVFFFLTRGEHIRTFEQPIFPLQDAETDEYYFEQRGDDSGRPVLARYLVESRRRLHMVVRLGTPQPRPSPTSAFRVFRQEHREVINDDGEAVFDHYWAELPKLDGRMLFVGKGCSRSYEAANGYPAMEEGVYFLDDRSFYDRTIMFRDDAERQYCCSDIGKWSGSPRQVRRCFPEQGPSNYSSPVWILP